MTGANWDSLAVETGFEPAGAKSAPTEKSKPEVNAQGTRFAADVGARGLGVFAGWPVDTASNILNLMIAGYGRAKGALGGTDLPSLIENPVGGSHHITQGYRAILSALTGSPTEGVAPASKPQEFLGNVGEMAGGAATMGLPQSGANAAKVLLSLVGAESGRQAAVKIAPDSPAASVIGTLLGGVAVPSAIEGRIQGAKALFGTAKDAAAGAQEKAIPVAEGIVDKNIKANAAGFPNAAANIDEGLRLQGKFPGVNLSVAEMTGAPGLAEMQSKYAALKPQNMNSEIARQGANVDALEQAFNTRAPAAEGISPNEARNAVNRTIAAREADLAAKEAAIAEKQKGLAGSLANKSQREAGNNLIDIANAARQKVKGTVTGPAYEAAYSAAGDGKIGVGNVLAEAEGILGRKLSDFAPETAPNTVRMLKTFDPKAGQSQMDKILEQFAGEPIAKPKAEATLRELDDVRKAINADIQQAKTSTAPTADMTLRNLYKLHGAIDEAVAKSPLPEEAKAAYADALNTYRTQYVPRFKEGVNANLFRQTSLNEPRLNPDDVVKTYFQPGGEREAGQFVKLFGKSPEAMQSAKGGIEDLYRQKVVNPTTGAIDPAAHARFMAQYARPIAIMDKAGMGLNGRLSGVGSTANAIGTAADTLSQVRAELQTKAKELKFDTAGDLQSAALKSPRTMGSVLSAMDGNGKAALARSVLEEAWKPVKDGVPRAGDKMSSYLMENERTVKMAMAAVEGSPTANKHFADIQDIAKTLQKIEFADIRGKLGGGTGNDPLKAATGVSIPTVWSQTRAVMAGRQGVGTAIAMVAGPAITKLSQVQFDGVMNRALHDPATAIALRDYLNSNPAQANTKAADLMRVLNAGKEAMGAAGRFGAKYWIGAPNYAGTLATIAPTLSEEGARNGR